MTGDTGLLTDHYELTMLQAALRDGTAERRCVFELFTRRLPEGRRYGVVAGTGRFLDAIPHFRYDDEQLAGLRRTGVIDEATCRWLDGYRFAGEVSGYLEGEVFLPGSPVLTVEGTFAEAVLLETLALSILNHDSAVASAAARMAYAAGDRPCIEMGSRRTHEESAVAAARAAYLAGFAATSNLAAGHRYGVPTAGTAAHSWTLLHEREADAFRAQVEALGVGTTLLVDTYDIAAGHPDRGRGGRPAPRRRPDRLRRPRRAGAPDPRAARLAGRRGHPHRAVRRPRRVRAGRPRDRSRGRIRRRDVGGDRVGSPDRGLRLQAGRGRGPVGGQALARTSRPAAAARPRCAATGRPARPPRRSCGRRAPPSAREGDRALQHPMVRGGELLDVPTLDESRAHLKRVLTTLPWQGLALSKGEPAIPTTYEEPPS